MAEEATIRPATVADLAAINVIHGHYAQDTHVSFDAGPYSEGQRQRWFAQFSESGPHRLLVADTGSVVTWSSARTRE